MTVFEQEQKARLEQVDERTRELIDQGFTFDGSLFPCTESDQLKYLSLKSLSQEFTWPVTLSLFVGEYVLQLSNLESFILTALAFVQGYKDSGRALRIEIQQATNLSQLRDIVDTRS